MTYDQECYNLAEHFLRSEPVSDHPIKYEEYKVDLAKAIQKAIEHWFDTPNVLDNSK